MYFTACTIRSGTLVYSTVYKQQGDWRREWSGSLLYILIDCKIKKYIIIQERFPKLFIIFIWTVQCRVNIKWKDSSCSCPSHYLILCMSSIVESGTLGTQGETVAFPLPIHLIISIKLLTSHPPPTFHLPLSSNIYYHFPSTFHFPSIFLLPSTPFPANTFIPTTSFHPPPFIHPAIFFFHFSDRNLKT